MCYALSIHSIGGNVLDVAKVDLEEEPIFTLIL